MFIKEQTIHHPDSKRNMNLHAWLQNTQIIQTNRKHNDEIETLPDFNILKHYKEVEEGLLYVKTTSENSGNYSLGLVYKLPAGIYKVKQLSISDSYLNIPVPSTYISVRANVNHEDGGYRLSGQRWLLSSNHQYHFPYSNIYYDDREQTVVYHEEDRPGFLRHGERLCDDHYMTQLVGTQPTMVDLVNAITTNIYTFMFTGGNGDLSAHCVNYRVASFKHFSENYSNLPDYNTRIRLDGLWCLLQMLGDQTKKENPTLSDYQVAKVIYDKLEELYEENQVETTTEFLKALNIDKDELDDLMYDHIDFD